MTVGGVTMNHKIPAVFSYIASKRNDLTLRENEIANFVIENPSFIVNNTITNIASKIGVSETSINRFCKKIGYKGFQDFKIALVQENFYREIQTVQKDVSQSSVISMLNDYKKILDNTSSMIKEEDLIESAVCIKNSNNIYVFDNHSTLRVAACLKQKLKLIDIDVIVINDWVSMKLYTSKCKKDDVFITFLNTMCSSGMMDCLSLVKQNKGKNIVITSYDSMKMNELSTIKFVTADKFCVENKDSLNEEITFIFIIDLLFNYLLKDERLAQEKQNSDSIIEIDQISNSYYFNM